MGEVVDLQMWRASGGKLALAMQRRIALADCESDLDEIAAEVMFSAELGDYDPALLDAAIARRRRAMKPCRDIVADAFAAFDGNDPPLGAA